MFSWVRIAMRARSLKGKKGKEADMGRRACVMHTCVLCSFIILSCFSLLLAFLQVRSFFFFLNLAAPGLSCGYRIFNLCCGVQDLLIVTYRI